MDAAVPDADERALSIEGREYDVAIVGGGIAGAGIARDAAMRGLETLLVERTDFAAGTTAYSTRLIHGGLRYLEGLEFGLVHESLQERETLARLAPHLVEPLTFLIPLYDAGRLERLKLRAGMSLYDLLAHGGTVPDHERLSASELREREPALPAEGLSGGFAYSDRQASFVERLCLENVLDARRHGADVLNHATVTEIRTAEAAVEGLSIRDRLAGTDLDVDSRAVVNATGPWADDLLGEVADESLVRPTKGIHLVVERLTEHALTLETEDDRVIFVVPWNGASLLGTTDTDFEGDPGDARATREDVEYLLGEARRVFPDLDVDDVRYAYAGVRPLFDPGGDVDAGDVSRRHRVVDHDLEGLFSLIGAKITPYRSAAEDATDAVVDFLGEGGSCTTDDEPLPGARGDEPDADDAPVSAATVEHLRGLYGTRASAVIERIGDDPALGEPLCEHSDDVLAQVTVAVEEEFARSITDVVFRRLTVGFGECEGRDAVETVADHMADLLEWDDDRRSAELERYEDVLADRHAFREAEPPAV